MIRRLLLLVFLATAAHAGLITCRPCLGSNDSYDWTTNFGPPNLSLNTLPSGSLALSHNGLAAVVSFAGGQGGRVDQTSQLPGWFGNFRVGDELLDSGYPGSGPISFAFGHSIFGLGANIQPDYFGPFTAQLCDSNGMCVEESGVSNANADGSAIFIGLRDAMGFSGATFSVTECMEECDDFAINQMDVVTPTPEPGSWWLFAWALLAVVRVKSLASEGVGILADVDSVSVGFAAEAAVVKVINGIRLRDFDSSGQRVFDSPALLADVVTPVGHISVPAGSADR